MIRYIDFHTHHVPEQQHVVAVVDGRDTWGIHPWNILPQHVQGKGESRQLIVPPSFEAEGRGILAIGECGFDALRGPSMAVQEAVFRQHVRLGEEMRKPLVVHCVKALDLLLRLRRELRPAMPWMLHGFRGKPRQMQSLLEAGCYVSFGLRHNEESLRLCPLQRLMLETDDVFRPSTETEASDVPLIAELYNKVAAARGIELRDLCDEMAENYRNFFRKEPFLT